MISIEAFFITNALFVAYSFIGIALFLRNREHEIISNRQPHVVLIMAFANVLLSVFILTDMLDDADTSPFVLLMWMYYLCTPPWLLSYLLRIMHLVYAFKLNQLKMYIANGEAKRIDRMTINLGKIFGVEAKGKANENLESGSDRIVLYGKIPHHLLRNATLSAILIGSIVALIMQLAWRMDVSQKTGGYGVTGRDEYLPVYLYTAVYLLVCPFFLYLLRGVRDDYHIKTEITASVVIFYPCFAVFLCGTFKIGSQFINDYSLLFIYGLGVVCFTLSIYLPVIACYKRRKRYAQLKIDRASFQNALNDKRLFFKLRELAAAQFCIENILFYEAYISKTKSHQQSLSKGNECSLCSGYNRAH